MTKESILAAIDALPVEAEISAAAQHLCYFTPAGRCVRVYRTPDTLLCDLEPGVTSAWSSDEDLASELARWGVVQR